jgi:hypothetical protein
MPKLIPLAVDPDIKASLSDMLDFRWAGTRSIKATFIIPDRRNDALQVLFRGNCIVRLIDDMPLSTETDDSPAEGLIKDHFAYRVEGSLFFRTQSEAFKIIYPNAAHYRFITLNTCLDVVSGAEPRFTVVKRDISAIPENARVGLPVYRRGSGWGSQLFLDRQVNEERIVGEVVLVGTFHDKSMDHRVAIVKVSSDFSSKRNKENTDGDLLIDTSIYRRRKRPTGTPISFSVHSVHPNSNRSTRQSGGLRTHRGVR